VEFEGKGSGERKRSALTKVPDKTLSRQTKIAAQLLGLGYSVEEVAEDTGMAVPRLKVLLRSRLFRTEMDKAGERFIKAEAAYAKERFHAKTPHMMDIVEEMADSPKTPAATRHAIARDYYGRVVPPKQEARQEAPVVVINITEADAHNIDATLAEYKDLGGEEIEDVEVEEVEGTSSN
jgi:hypothetical protein